MANFSLELKLKTETYQEDILNKRLEMARSIYNGLLNVVYKRYNEMIKTRKYRNLVMQLQDDRTNKELWKEYNDMYVFYRLTKFDFEKDVIAMKNHFKGQIDSMTSQKIASRVFRAFEEMRYGHKKMKYKNKNSVNSVEGKHINKGIRISGTNLIWFNLVIPFKRNYNNEYENEAFLHEMCYARIIRKYIRGKYKFYLQIIFKGEPPKKKFKNSTKNKNELGNGNVGLDIGTKTIAIVSKDKIDLLDLAKNSEKINEEIKSLNRKMERSLRINNPQNYNKKGKIKKCSKKWRKTKHFNKMKDEIVELHRKKKVLKKIYQDKLVNYIITFGNVFYIEKMDYKEMQEKGKYKGDDENRKYNRLNHYGKSLIDYSPAHLIEILNYKLECYGGKLIKVDPYKIKASQYNHFDDTYKKKDVRIRWNDFNGIYVQRDLYSAFLLMNLKDNLKQVDRKKCLSNFNKFIELHNNFFE